MIVHLSVFTSLRPIRCSTYNSLIWLSTTFLFHFSFFILKASRVQERRELSDLWPVGSLMPTILMKYRALDAQEISQRLSLAKERDALRALAIEIKYCIHESNQWETQYDEYGRKSFFHVKTGQTSSKEPAILSYKPPSGWDEWGNMIPIGSILKNLESVELISEKEVSRGDNAVSNIPLPPSLMNGVLDINMDESEDAVSAVEDIQGRERGKEVGGVDIDIARTTDTARTVLMEPRVERRAVNIDPNKGKHSDAEWVALKDWIVEASHRGQTTYRNTLTGEVTSQPPTLFDHIPQGRPPREVVGDAARTVLCFIRMKILSHIEKLQTKKKALDSHTASDENLYEKENGNENDGDAIETADDDAASNTPIEAEAEVVRASSITLPSTPSSVEDDHEDDEDLSIYEYDIETVEMLADESAIFAANSAGKIEAGEPEEKRKGLRSFLQCSDIR